MPHQQAMPQQQAHAENPIAQRSKLRLYAGLFAGVATIATVAYRSMQPKLIVTRAELDRCPLSSVKDMIRARNNLNPDMDVLCLDEAGQREVLVRGRPNCFTYAKSDYEIKNLRHPIDLEALKERATCQDLDKPLTETHKWKKKTPGQECTDGTTHVRSYLSEPRTPARPKLQQDYHFVVNPDSENPTHKVGAKGIDVLNKTYVEPDGSLAKRESIIATPDELVEYSEGRAFDVCNDYCVEREEAPKA